MRTTKVAAAAVICLLATILATPGAHATTVEATSTVQFLDREPTRAEWNKGVVGCLIEVTGQKADGEYITADPLCAVAKDIRDVHEAFAAMEDDEEIIIATHHEDFDYGGSFISITGTVCNGGYLNLSSDWIDRVSSSWSICWIWHFRGYDLSGMLELIPGGNLTYNNNLTRSIRYT